MSCASSQLPFFACHKAFASSGKDSSGAESRFTDAASSAAVMTHSTHQLHQLTPSLLGQRPALGLRQEEQQRRCPSRKTDAHVAPAVAQGVSRSGFDAVACRRQSGDALAPRWPGKGADRPRRHETADIITKTGAGAAQSRGEQLRQINGETRRTTRAGQTPSTKHHPDASAGELIFRYKRNVVTSAARKSDGRTPACGQSDARPC